MRGCTTFAVVAGEAGDARARVVMPLVVARAAILARITQTFVDVCVTNIECVRDTAYVQMYSYITISAHAH